jgi:hypothetical protein
MDESISGDVTLLAETHRVVGEKAPGWSVGIDMSGIILGTVAIEAAPSAPTARCGSGNPLRGFPFAGLPRASSSGDSSSHRRLSRPAALAI